MAGTPEQIRLKVLDLAAEGANELFMLPPEQKWEDGVVHPQTSSEATRDVVETLTREGQIVIYAIRLGRDDPPLDVDAALAAVADDRNWHPPGPEGAEVLYEPAITESGEAEYRRLRNAAAGHDATT